MIWLVALLALSAPKRTPGLIAQGRNAYAIWCVACHGERGAGDGPTAQTLNPRPRNFATEKFKQGSKPGQVFNTISRGVPGTGMAPFKNLSDEEKWALAWYVLELKAGKSHK